MRGVFVVARRAVRGRRSGCRGRFRSLAAFSLLVVAFVPVPSGGATAAALPGTVLGWGLNSYGTIGDGTTDARRTPVNASAMPGWPAGVQVTAVSEPGGVVSALALTSDGRVLAWGANDNGQLGNNTTRDSYSPTFVQNGGGGQLSNIKAIASGAQSNYAITHAGQLLAWGKNDAGQLGIGTTVDSHVPYVVPLPAGDPVVHVASSVANVVALTASGALYEWGSIVSTSQLGATAQRNSPVQINCFLPAETVVTALSGAFSGGTMGVVATIGGVPGQVRLWGANGNGQLGNNTVTGPVNAATTPLLPVGTIVTTLTSANRRTFAVTSTGDVYVWGHNGQGQLGIGNTVQQQVPGLL